MISNLIRDLFEGMIVLAVGAIAVSTVRRTAQGKVSVFRCGACRRPTSRAYPQCPHCAAPLAEHS